MDDTAVVTLALSLSWQSRWKQLQQSGRFQAVSSSKSYTRDDAIALARRFAVRFATANAERSQLGSWILRSIEAVSREIQGYESSYLRNLALDCIPVDHLETQAASLMKEESLAYQDALVQALVQWARNSFLKWADPVKCSTCGGPTEGIQGGVPTNDERRHGAGRVELYRCINESETCKGTVTRFPRYSSLEKLLQTRTGRCGEFAAVFMLLLRALGLRARYIWNSEDHVWNEYYSEELKRWVHVDSCEGVRDKNLLYDCGWGKKMRYCIAFSLDSVTDVTRSYVSDWEDCLSRRYPDLESRLKSKVANITMDLRSHLPLQERKALETEDQKEEEWLRDSMARQRIAARETLSGRSSGTKEWRARRSELGDANAITAPAMKASKKIACLSQNASEVRLNGQASFDEHNAVINLTADKPDEIGSAFISLPSELKDIIFSFEFRIKHQAAQGADGMALVLHADPQGLQAIGSGGCELGYGGLKNSLAIEIDTYRSRDRCDDPPTPHISVQDAGIIGNSAHHRHSLWCTRPGTLPDLDNGRDYTLRIHLSLSRRVLRIFFNDDQSEDSFVELTSKPVQLTEAWLTRNLYIGWSAATGGLHQSHQVTDFELWQAVTDESTPSR